jgi:hypothetical protein
MRYGVVSMTIWTGVFLLAAATLGVGCKGIGYCVDGLELGTTYRVTVLEPANNQSQYGVETSYGRDFGIGGAVDEYPCGTGFDFVGGSSFEVEPISKRDLRECYGRMAMPSGVSEVEILEAVDGVTGDGRLMVTPRFRVRRGAGCVGIWELGFISHLEDPPLEEPVPGEYPPVLLVRRFNPTSEVDVCRLQDSRPTSMGNCFDYFVVRIEKA